MGEWKYEGHNREGKKVRGVINGSNEREVKKLLRYKGIRAKKLQAPSILELDLGLWLVENGFAKPFTQSDLANFTKQLAIMIDAGIPILQALEILFKQQKNPVLKNAIKKIASQVGSGKTLADAMEKQKGFDKLYCNLIRAGETGGILDMILEKLSEHMDRQEKIKKQIKSAMMYPSVVVAVGVGVVYLMMVFVVPKFTDMLSSSGQEVPWVTQMVVDISDFMRHYTLIILPAVFVLLVILSKFIKTSTGKPIFDKLMMNLPLFGGIIIKGNLASFCRTLSTMLSSGISLVDSLEVCIETLDNKIMASDMSSVQKAVIEGKTLAEPMIGIQYFPAMVAEMVKVGEQTGKIDVMLEKVSDVFEEEVNSLLSNMTKLIEPIILVVLGGIVGFILIAMYLPMFKQAGGIN